LTFAYSARGRGHARGPLYHVTSRGDGREAIFRADGDRQVFFDVLAGV
jgi:REP-associated tyrosine transposase